MKKYDYIVVGSGLYGATFTSLALKEGKKVLVVDKRSHIGGNIYTKEIDGINVHFYGAHIFHTDEESVWSYVNSFVKFNNFINSPLAKYKKEYYHLPFNMYTFEAMWGVKTPEEAKEIIEKQVKEANITEIKNLEDQALSLVGSDIYHKLIKGYTEKQWGKACKNLPASIIRRVPVRFTYNNNYFNDKYSGIPIGGYTLLIEKMLEGADILLDLDFFKHRQYLEKMAEKIIYTGPLDEFYDYRFGRLEYRSLKFKIKRINKEYYQNNCVINYTTRRPAYTRIIEHKYFEDVKTPTTVITIEYPRKYTKNEEKYYPVNDEVNEALALKYKELAKKEKQYYFGGRLANYKYYDMDDTVLKAINDAKDILKNGTN
ncbi:MAG TPA: UDP-galactopyranose mutase [Candidatus Onthovivens sp.]|nr:UDP-galactopyranose mutase [Candidatus Onthovivens sp.]